MTVFYFVFLRFHIYGSGSPIPVPDLRFRIPNIRIQKKGKNTVCLRHDFSQYSKRCLAQNIITKGTIKFRTVSGNNGLPAHRNVEKVTGAITNEKLELVHSDDHDSAGLANECGASTVLVLTALNCAVQQQELESCPAVIMTNNAAGALAFMQSL